MPSSLTLLEHLMEPSNKVRTDQALEVVSPIEARHLGKHGLDSAIHSSDVENVAAAVRRSPDANFVLIDVRSRLGIGNGVREVADLLRGCPCLVSLSPNPRLSHTRREMGNCDVKCSANVPRSISLSAENPWAITRHGRGPGAAEGL